MFSFESFPLWLNLAILAVAAVVVWFAGARLDGAVEHIARRTKLGSAFGGFLLLAFSTSLPELATTVSGGLIGNATLVTNNLLGGIAMQTAILAVADFAFTRAALSYFTPRFTVLLGGVSLVMLLGLALALMAWRDPVAVWGVGLGTALLAAAHVALVYMSYRSRDHPGWAAVDGGPEKEEAGAGGEVGGDDKNGNAGSLRRSWGVFAATSVAILCAGWAVMTSAEAVTVQTGLAANFVGATLVAISTSLPELSATISSARRGDTEMAISHIFGSNLWCVSMLFVGDVFYRKGPLLAEASNQTMFMAALGVVVTAVYLWGLLERKDNMVGRVGVDSAVVFLLYLAGLAILYSMG